MFSSDLWEGLAFLLFHGANVVRRLHATVVMFADEIAMTLLPRLSLLMLQIIFCHFKIIYCSNPQFLAEKTKNV